MKKLFICLFCLALIISLIPVNEFEVSAAVRVLPQRTNAYNKYNHTAGLNWLSNQEEVEAIVNTENSKPDEDNSIYDIAKNSIIMKLDNPIAYAQGYKNYIDMDNTTVAPFIQDGNVFVPIKYIAENLGAEFIWDNNKKQALIEGSETTKIIVEKNEIVINDSNKAINVSPVMNCETLFVPTSVIELVFQQKVLFDERGVIVITTEAIQEMIEDRHWDLIAQSDFDLDRKKIVYPHKQDVIRLMMSSSNRSALNTDVSTMQEEIAPYLKMSYKELAEYVEEESQYNEDGTKRHMGERPDFYRAALFMSLLYEMNPNEDLAMRIIIMAYHSAICFDSLATYD